MDSTKPRSTVPITITIVSEQELVECEGIYSERDDGFTLEFCIRNDKFTIVHTDICTRLSVQGVISYDLELKDEDSFTELVTAFGRLRLKVHTISRDITKKSYGVNVYLKYLLCDDGPDDMERDVNLAARFSV